MINTKKLDSYYYLARREGAMAAVDVFCDHMKIDFIRPMSRYKLFTWFFVWYSGSKIGKWINK